MKTQLLEREEAERERRVSLSSLGSRESEKKHSPLHAMASPAPSPRGTPPTLKDRLSEPLNDPLSAPLDPQTTANNAVASAGSEQGEEQQRQRASPMLLSFAPAAVAAIVSPLPPRVASRWSSEGGPRPLPEASPLSTRESIDAKLAAAEAKRQASFEGRRENCSVTFFLSFFGRSLSPL